MNVRREKVSSKILLDGWLSVLVKEKYRKITEKKRKERKEKDPVDDFRGRLLVRPP